MIPALDWLVGYGADEGWGDLQAGLTVGVMLVPQSMAYALLAGLPTQYGLYASLIPLVIYAAFGTSRHLSVGPVAVNMLILAAGVGSAIEALDVPQDQYVELAILLTTMTGILEIAMGMLGFGFMVNFLSRPVIAGFMTAAPLIIAASQLGNLVGLDLPDIQYVYMYVWETIRHAGEMHPVGAGIGLAGIGFLLGLQLWKPRWPGALIWVVLAIGATWGFDLGGDGSIAIAGTTLAESGIATVGSVPEGLPPLEMPVWSWESVRALVPTALTMALVQFMAIMSLGEAFASEHDYSVDANKELFAIGLANFLGSFFRGIPVSGSFSRSAVNDQAGAQTPMSNVVAAVMVAIALLFLTPLFQYLPTSALAAIIMVACVGMIDVPELKYLLETRWIDGAVALLTFLATLVISVQQGILIGVGASILVVLYDLTRPNVAELGHVPGTQEFRDLERNPETESISGIHIVRIDSRFAFANAKILKEHLIEEAADEEMRAFIIDTSGVNDLDTTATAALKEVVEELSERDIDFYIVGAKGPVRGIIRRSGLQDLIGEEHFFLNTHLAVRTILEDWNEEEEYGPVEEAQQREEEVDEVREQLEEERERIEARPSNMSEEREQLREEIELHEAQREELDLERDMLVEELRQAESRRQKMRTEMEERQEALEAQQEELEAERERMEAERKRLEAERKKTAGETDDSEPASEATSPADAEDSNDDNDDSDDNDASESKPRLEEEYDQPI
jgi:SulP family sulfate permease